MKKLILLILLVVISVSLKAQEKKFVIPDSLVKEKYTSLKDSVIKYIEDYTKAESFLKIYYRKAIRNNDSIRIVEAYNLNSLITKNINKKMSYLDSAIRISENINNQRYPAAAYLSKGVINQESFNYEKALTNYNLALNYAEKHKNHLQIFYVKYNIGILKNDIGEYNEALNVFKECYEMFYKENYNHEVFFLSIYGLSDTYNRLKKTDSASYFNKLGYNQSKKNQNNKWKNYFILMEGINLYNLENYQSSIDSIYNTIPFLTKAEDKINLSEAFYYLGKAYYSINKKEKGIEYLIKMDSIIQETKLILPEHRSAYKLLINHYKENNNIKNQLKYINVLLFTDSIIKRNYKQISKGINIQYETPLLLKEKEVLINSLKKSNKNILSILLFTLFILLIIFAVFYIIIKRQIIYSKQYKKIIEEYKRKPKITKKTIANSIDNISKDKVDEIINGLDRFEKDLGYLNNNTNLRSLANSLNTNTSYLSKVINYYKYQNFTTYINELRITHFLEVLPYSKKLQKYTIKALAEEFGFNNSESFAAAFYKITKIKPSFYINQLNKET